MKFGTFFTKKVVTAGPKDSLANVAKLMQQHNVGTVVVVEQKKGSSDGSSD